MKIKDIFKSIKNRIAPKRASKAIVEIRNQTFADGRVTVDHPYTNYRKQQILRAKDYLNQSWKLEFLEEEQVCNMRTSDILTALSDTSPEFNRALHDFIQFVVTEHTLVADNPEGQRIIDETIELMRTKKEPFTTKLERAASSVFLHGAIFSELVFDLQGILFSNFKVIDATLVEFQEDEDPIDGQM